MSNKRERKPREVSVRSSTYEALSRYAQQQGTQVSQVVDEIIRKYLDEQERTS